jgi:hypothetical protein
MPSALLVAGGNYHLIAAVELVDEHVDSLPLGHVDAPAYDVGMNG